MVQRIGQQTVQINDHRGRHNVRGAVPIFGRSDARHGGQGQQM